MTLPLYLRNWPPAAREDFEERAGILEFEAGLTRPQANAAAQAIVRQQWIGKEAEASWACR